ncbi:MAG: hypothetical protein ACRBDI_03030 [Alphaproteobacteria bacterium]
MNREAYLILSILTPLSLIGFFYFLGGQRIFSPMFIMGIFAIVFFLTAYFHVLLQVKRLRDMGSNPYLAFINLSALGIAAIMFSDFSGFQKLDLFFTSSIGSLILLVFQILYAAYSMSLLFSKSKQEDS